MSRRSSKTKTNSAISSTTLAPKIKKLNRNTQQNVRNAKRDGPKTLFTAQEIAHAKPFERSDTVVICSEAFQRLLKPKKSGKKWTTVAEGLYPGVTIVPTGAMVKNLANLIAKSTKPWHHVNNLILFIGCDDLMKSSEQFLKNDFRDLITNVKERMELTQTDLTRSDARLYVVLLPEFGAKGAQAKAINDYLKNESTEGTDMVVTLVEMQLGEIAQKHPGFFSKQKPWQIAHHVAEQIVSNILEKEEISWSKKKLCGMAKATVNNQQNQDSTVSGNQDFPFIKFYEHKGRPRAPRQEVNEVASQPTSVSDQNAPFSQESAAASGNDGDVDMSGNL